MNGYAFPLLETVEKMIQKYEVRTSKAAVFGSGTGHTTFLLTKHFDNVRNFVLNDSYMVIILHGDV